MPPCYPAPQFFVQFFLVEGGGPESIRMEGFARTKEAFLLARRARANV